MAGDGNRPPSRRRAQRLPDPHPAPGAQASTLVLAAVPLEAMGELGNEHSPIVEDGREDRCIAPRIHEAVVPGGLVAEGKVHLVPGRADHAQHLVLRRAGPHAAEYLILEDRADLPEDSAPVEVGDERLNAKGTAGIDQVLAAVRRGEFERGLAHDAAHLALVGGARAESASVIGGAARGDQGEWDEEKGWSHGGLPDLSNTLLSVPIPLRSGKPAANRLPGRRRDEEFW